MLAGTLLTCAALHWLHTGFLSGGGGGGIVEDSICILHAYQEYISSKSVQLLQTAFLHIDVTSTSVSGGTSCTYVNHSFTGSSSQTI